MEEIKFCNLNDLHKEKNKKPKKEKTLDIFKIPKGLIKKVKIQQKKVKSKD
jgi:hypothetical protein